MRFKVQEMKIIDEPKMLVIDGIAYAVEKRKSFAIGQAVLLNKMGWFLYIEATTRVVNGNYVKASNDEIMNFLAI